MMEQLSASNKELEWKLWKQASFYRWAEHNQHRVRWSPQNPLRCNLHGNSKENCETFVKHVTKLSTDFKGVS